MARSGGRNNNQRDCSNGSQEGHRRGRESSYSSQYNNTKKKLCSVLNKHIFDYGHKIIANEIKTL